MGPWQTSVFAQSCSPHTCSPLVGCLISVLKRGGVTTANGLNPCVVRQRQDCDKRRGWPFTPSSASVSFSIRLGHFEGVSRPRTCSPHRTSAEHIHVASGPDLSNFAFHVIWTSAFCIISTLCPRFASTSDYAKTAIGNRSDQRHPHHTLKFVKLFFSGLA
jgi:hypothetical protein